MACRALTVDELIVETAVRSICIEEERDWE